MNCRLNTSSRSESARQWGHADWAGLTNKGTPPATLGGRRDWPEWCGSHEANASRVGTAASSGRSLAGSSDERRISARQEALSLKYDRSDEPVHGDRVLPARTMRSDRLANAVPREDPRRVAGPCGRRQTASAIEQRRVSPRAVRTPVDGSMW